MALALYRTYRPGTLADVVGQEHVTEPLARALDSDRTHHAYLFSGPRGCGKTSTARILARSLNCEQGPTSTPCGTCRSCVDLAPNGPGSIDVVEMDAATHRGIDDARDLREKAIYAPAASRYRVYIIDEAHQLTNEAANALLKLIEEPPAHLRFIFATTEPDKIIATIRSRTFHYPFRLVPARTLADHLARVCAAEGVPAEPAALAVVARAGAGSVRDSLSVLGQLLAGVGPEGLTHAEAVQALGLTDDALIDGFVEALSTGSVAAMLRVVDGVISAGHDPRRFVADVLERLRDLIVLRADPGALESGIIDLPDEAGQRLLAQAEALGLAELSHAADLVSAGLSEVKGATAPRLQLELLCARLALHHPGDDLVSVLARLDRLERSMGAAPAVPAGVAPAPGRAAGSGSGGEGPERVSWPPTEAVAALTAGLARELAAVAHPAAAADESKPGDQPAPGPAQPPATRAGGHPGSAAAGSGPGSTSASAPPRRPTLRSGGGVPVPPGPQREAGATAPESDRVTAGEPSSDGRADSVTASSESVAVRASHGQSDRSAGDPSASPEPTAGEARDPLAVAASGRTGPDRQAQLSRVTASWPAVLDRLAQSSRVAWTIFAGARPLSLSQDTLAVAVAEPGMAAAITQRGHDLRLRQALLDVLEVDVTIDVIYEGGPGEPSVPSPAAASRPGAGDRPDRQSARPPRAASAAPAASASESASAPAAAPAPSGRRAAATADDVQEEPDVPSDDDPDIDEVDGLALVTRELGARTITEIDHG